MSQDTFLVTQGSLYPALVRMKRRGWVTTSWRVTENSPGCSDQLAANADGTPR
jgi:DNA-binding PadR family transcriptional regulator